MAPKTRRSRSTGYSSASSRAILRQLTACSSRPPILAWCIDLGRGSLAEPLPEIFVGDHRLEEVSQVLVLQLTSGVFQFLRQGPSVQLRGREVVLFGDVLGPSGGAAGPALPAGCRGIRGCGLRRPRRPVLVLLRGTLRGVCPTCGRPPSRYGPPASGRGRARRGYPCGPWYRSPGSWRATWSQAPDRAPRTSLCSGGCSFYPFTAPAVRPETMRRWKIRTSITSGTVTTTAPRPGPRSPWCRSWRSSGSRPSPGSGLRRR